MYHRHRIDRFGKESERDRVGMTEEPGDKKLGGYTADDPKDDREGNNVPPAPKEPSATRHNDEDTKPRHLANSSEADVGERGSSQPKSSVSVILRCERPLAEINTEKDDEQAGNVRHERGRQGKEQRAENERQGSE